jgi:hypothetical protein
MGVSRPDFGRPDYFCEDYQEFGEVLADLAVEAERLAQSVPTDGFFLRYRERLYAVARELSAIEGGLRTTVALEGRLAPSTLDPLRRL